MNRKRIILGLVAILVLAFGMTWISSDFRSFQGWGSFLAAIILGVGILAVGWWALRTEAIPNWVGWLMVGAALLRLGCGLIWWVSLPEWGYGTDSELAGYVMSDAFERDTAAWELSQTDKPLWAAFTDFRLADQYGGLLFISAAIYRTFGGEVHQPLMMVVVAASVSALSIPLVWIITRRLWGAAPANVAAWIIALYPEAVLLGSSQMREAFMMTMAGMGVYGLLLYWQDRKMLGIGWVLGTLALSLPISYLFALMLVLVLISMVLILDRARIMRNWILWVVLACLMIVGVAGVWFLGERIYPEGASNPWELIQQWLVFAARWERRTAEISSGWMAKVFRRSPEWMNFWIILGYGSVQPFLPAALIANGNWVWRIIAIWRALGWTILLLFLLFASLRAGKDVRKKFYAAGMSVLIWIGVILSAYRGGGDQWDNPRYRVTLVILQAGLVGWVWTEQRLHPDPWLRRILVGSGWVFAWFVPWYLRRYSSFTWPVIDLFKTLGLGFASAALYWVWDWVRTEKIL